MRYLFSLRIRMFGSSAEDLWRPRAHVPTDTGVFMGIALSLWCGL